MTVNASDVRPVSQLSKQIDRLVDFLWPLTITIGVIMAVFVIAFLAILFTAINEQPPETTLSIPDDFVSQVMEGIGLSGREVGLNAMLARIKTHARLAASTVG